MVFKLSWAVSASGTSRTLEEEEHRATTSSSKRFMEQTLIGIIILEYDMAYRPNLMVHWVLKMLAISYQTCLSKEDWHTSWNTGREAHLPKREDSKQIVRSPSTEALTQVKPWLWPYLEPFTKSPAPLSYQGLKGGVVHDFGARGTWTPWVRMVLQTGVLGIPK